MKTKEVITIMTPLTFYEKDRMNARKIDYPEIIKLLQDGYTVQSVSTCSHGGYLFTTFVIGTSK